MLWSAVLRSEETIAKNMPLLYAWSKAARAKRELKRPPDAPSTTSMLLSPA